MSDNKVTLPREVARALEMCVKRYGEKTTLKYHAEDTNSWKNAVSALNGFDLMTLASALVNGYTIETTPEEMVREYYDSFGGSPSAQERKQGVVDTLNLLGIRIEGVNA